MFFGLYLKKYRSYIFNLAFETFNFLLCELIKMEQMIVRYFLKMQFKVKTFTSTLMTVRYKKKKIWKI